MSTWGQGELICGSSWNVWALSIPFTSFHSYYIMFSAPHASIWGNVDEIQIVACKTGSPRCFEYTLGLVIKKIVTASINHCACRYRVAFFQCSFETGHACYVVITTRCLHGVKVSSSGAPLVKCVHWVYLLQRFHSYNRMFSAPHVSIWGNMDVVQVVAFKNGSPRSFEYTLGLVIPKIATAS